MRGSRTQETQVQPKNLGPNKYPSCVIVEDRIIIGVLLTQALALNPRKKSVFGLEYLKSKIYALGTSAQFAKTFLKKFKEIDGDKAY